MIEKTKAILQALIDKPMITTAEIESLTGYNLTTIKSQLSTLAKQGYIIRHAETHRDAGHYEVTEEGRKAVE